MKKNLHFCSWLILLACIAGLNQCKKDDVQLTVSDNDGNIYPCIEINHQIWMAENLKSTRLNDGTQLINLEDQNSWVYSSEPGYCWYNNDAAANKEIYGALYNYEVVNTGKICPSGWHVPDDSEWNSLITFLGGDSIATIKLKSTGSSSWSNQATNETGFSAEPGGFRWVNFVSLTYLGYWWSSSSTSELNHFLQMSYKSLVRATGNGYGYSIRCVQDN